MAAASRAALLFTGDADGTLAVWDFGTGKKLKEFDTGIGWASLAVNPQGTLIAGAVSPERPMTRTVKEGWQLILRDARSGQELWRRPIAATLGLDAFSPDGRRPPRS